MNTNQLCTVKTARLLGCFERKPVSIDRGEGTWIYDTDGVKYLDFIGSLGTCVVGHSNPVVLDAVRQQLDKIVTCTNLYFNEPQVKLAEALSRVSGLEKCFFSNSGAESVETALKLARKSTGKKEIICTTNAFHGRTFGALSATSKEHYRTPFQPLVPGFERIPFSDATALKQAIGPDTAAFILEPIQGEGGVILPSPGYLKEVREICTDKNVLLILDEVQTGVARTGKFFAYQHENIFPDIVCTAKGLGNGFPIGATIAAEGVDFAPGDHGSTFGGNALACSAALAVIKLIESQGLAQKAANDGAWLSRQLETLAWEDAGVKGVHGKGLMLGIDLIGAPATQTVDACRTKGALVNAVGPQTLRVLPPLTVKREECEFAIQTLKEVLGS